MLETFSSIKAGQLSPASKLAIIICIAFEKEFEELFYFDFFGQEGKMKKIIIIGGGIAGLSAGIFAQKAGFDSVIIEQHAIIGGECTGWDRKGFHIDGCIHWLTGTKPETDLYKLWVETGALENTEVYQPDFFSIVEHEGQTIWLHRDLDKTKNHLLEISPDDHEQIEELMNYTERFFSFQIPCRKPFDLMNISDKIKLGMSMKSVGPVMKDLSKITIGEYVERFNHPVIKEALKSGVVETYSAYILPFTLATFISGNGGRPIGGSKAMAQRMEDKYLNLGGNAEMRWEVTEILIEEGIAKGVLLADGSKVYGDYIVPACDAHITLQKLLKGKYTDKKFEEKYANQKAYPLFSCIYASFGVDADLSAYPADFAFQTIPFSFEDGRKDQISIKHYCYEPSFAPKGKSILIAYNHANYDWWKEKRNNMDDYKAEKVRLANDIIERMETRFPELKGKIALLDMATPVTYERYCGAYRGAWMSFGITPEGKNLNHDGRIKGIKNLYMAGQWLMPSGGLPTALVTGKWAIQRICHAEKINTFA